MNFLKNTKNNKKFLPFGKENASFAQINNSENMTRPSAKAKIQYRFCL